VFERDRSLPPLVALRAFEAAARHGSMRQAAEAMSVSHSVVSRHIRNLESWLGVRLFEQGRRSACLTPEGQRYFLAVSGALDRISAATEGIRPGNRARTLNIWCVPGLASRWLLPKLGAVRELIPDVEISIRPTLDVPDLTKYDVDLLIGYGPIEVDGLLQTELMVPRVIPVASPAFVKAHPGIGEARDLMRAPLLHEVSADYWRQWFEANGILHTTPLKGPRLWYLNSVLDAARNSQGVALAPEIVVAGEVREGHLVALTDSRIRLGCYNLYTRKEKAANRAMIRLREWLIAEFASFESRPAAN
jgi:LysR family glycine cleavage system transcriptional activator